MYHNMIGPYNTLHHIIAVLGWDEGGGYGPLHHNPTIEGGRWVIELTATTPFGSLEV